MFFKWIKQHLQIKHFYGTSEQTVTNQICIALIAFCLLMYFVDIFTNNPNRKHPLRDVHPFSFFTSKSCFLKIHSVQLMIFYVTLVNLNRI
ncbi:hypothetical protein [Paenibacillus graminis]|uniref:hypothetical protein n=1 Tax=Paenibacillus graminis TaxID=189425 RepID=UPI0009DE77A8